MGIWPPPLLRAPTGVAGTRGVLCRRWGAPLHQGSGHSLHVGENPLVSGCWEEGEEEEEGEGFLEGRAAETAWAGAVPTVVVIKAIRARWEIEGNGGLSPPSLAAGCWGVLLLLNIPWEVQDEAPPC